MVNQFKQFKAIISLKNGMKKVERMSKEEVAHLVYYFRRANKFGGEIMSARIIWERSHDLYLELN